ncbi:uncharacterized protein LOC122312660 [Carya illinoinensis]|uniref:uncharacterized protein LOC122312660 n=1 Tax=Carya illinoinensis TaxID=32201 RepID=UPI001C719A57|nr:uncharacterized protein LOC122312660 [Carya illinoinensis]
MNKAYNRVEWGFLDIIMEKMGFEKKWRKMVMRCVKSISYSVLINGDPNGPIMPSRGLIQGDLLSPYLFLLYTEGLVAMLAQAEENKLVEGLKIYKSSPWINNLLFAYYNLFFCRASMQTNAHIHQLLKEYEQVSSQKVNRENTSMVFCTNVDSQLK